MCSKNFQININTSFRILVLPYGCGKGRSWKAEPSTGWLLCMCDTCLVAQCCMAAPPVLSLSCPLLSHKHNKLREANHIPSQTDWLACALVCVRAEAGLLQRGRDCSQSECSQADTASLGIRHTSMHHGAVLKKPTTGFWWQVYRRRRAKMLLWDANSEVRNKFWKGNYFGNCTSFVMLAISYSFVNERVVNPRKDYASNAPLFYSHMARVLCWKQGPKSI